MPKFEKVEPHGAIWKPEKRGDKLVGTLEGIRETTGGEYGPQTALDFSTAEGAKTVFCDAVLTGYAKTLEIGAVYQLLFMGWGDALVKEKSTKNRYRNWEVSKAVA